MQQQNDTLQTPLSPEESRVLCDALGDTPETVISVHQLRRGLCKAWAEGDREHHKGAIIQGDSLPSEPTGFGPDPNILWDLLKGVGAGTMNRRSEI